MNKIIEFLKGNVKISLGIVAFGLGITLFFSSGGCDVALAPAAIAPAVVVPASTDGGAAGAGGAVPVVSVVP